MIDLHTHSLLSDGELIPSELARRYEEKGFKAIAITDHVDLSNIKFVVESIVEFCRAWPKNRIQVIPGIELTHLALEQFKPACEFARNKGIKIIVAHGETLVEPVLKGTNLAALKADIDILAHPGLISAEEARLAAKRGILLELSARKGHCLGNGNVARLALKYRARLCINSDAHAPSDIPTPLLLKNVGLGAGLAEKDLSKLYSFLNTHIR
ncbi:MAG: PHP domain-containing protein [Candidatus Omnitrophica bacterium CG_4_10_14_0_2_um_filter_44_9]|nr:MAG: PHP domain-containing protein [Candidatus Omnitrophica bacterium CG_4_10_14_0_8_um_filter_44_12]PIZ84564.1 MAG: PHP domain-containing protein [Candidatus Omnitrophica bacterium CG_4_10_14_0_2_um_filter_44_9]